MGGKFLPTDFSKSALVDLRKSGNLEGNYCQEISVNWVNGGEFLPIDISKSANWEVSVCQQISVNLLS